MDDVIRSTERHKGRFRAHNQIELEPWYKDNDDEIVEPYRVTLQTQYFWTHWLRVLGAGPAVVLIRLRMHCYFNRKTGENRNTCWPGILTLARELGVERKAIMRYLARLEVFDFIRRTPRTRWSAMHNHPVRTTDLYRVRMWDPVVPAESDQPTGSNERELPEEGDFSSQQNSHPQRSPYGTFGKEGPDSGEKSQIGTLDAVPKEDPMKKYLEEVPNERNVVLATAESIGTKTNPGFGGSGPMALKHLLHSHPRGRDARPQKRLRNVLPGITTSDEKRDQLLRVEALAGQMLEQLGDSQSRHYYRLVARAFLAADLERLVHQTLSDVKDGDRLGTLRRPAAVFTARIKQLAEAHGIELGTAS